MIFFSGIMCALMFVVCDSYAVDIDVDSDGGITNKQIAAVRTKVAPVIDGVFSPGEWSESSITSDFHQTRPNYQTKPTYKTIVRVSYDDDFLYVSAELFDDEPDKIIAYQMMQGGSTYSDDGFDLYLSPFNNNRSGYYFRVTTNDVRNEAIFSPGTRWGLDMNWRGIWYAKTGKTDKGWIAEMAIPFKSLNFDANNDTWGISFGREIGRLRESLGWTSYNRNIGADSLGELVGIEGIKQGLGLDVKAEMTVGHNKDYETGESNFEVRPSVDIFYKITPSLTAVLTANTDFSAVDVDDQVVDLTRFSVFLPEKRDFFLQDADMFRFGNIYRNGTPFFSRRIGLDEDNMPIDLKLGLKLTGRIGNWNVGALNVVQGRGDHNGNANLFVGRVSYNLLEDSSIGMIMTHGDPLTGANSYMFGADLKLTSKTLLEGRKVSLDAWAQRSHSLEKLGNDKAFGARLTVEASEGFSGLFNIAHIEENFDPALGFVNRENINEVFLSLDYTYRPNNSWIRDVRSEFQFYDVYEIGGDLLTREIEWEAIRVQNNSGDRVQVGYKYIQDVLVEDYEIVDGVIIPPGSYEFSSGSVTMQSAWQRKISVRLEYNKGSYYGGNRTRIEGRVYYRPTKYFNFNISYTQNNAKLPYGDFKTKLYSIGGDVAFSSSWSWITRFQYDNVSKEGGINSRLRYSPRPGKDFYIVLNHGYFVDEDGKRHSSNNDIVAKVGYTFRF